MSVTPLYAAVATLLFVLLSFRVIGVRRSAGVALGDGGDRLPMRRLRAHGNFAEYAPLAIVLMAFAEIQGLMAILVHVLGSALLVGRGLHAFGVSRTPEDFRFRVAGMSLTFAVLGLAAVANLMLSADAWVSGE